MQTVPDIIDHGTVEIVGIPMDLGQTLRGVDLGPGALRYAGLRRRLRELGCRVIDRGNLQVPVRDALPADCPDNCLPAIRDVCDAAYTAASEAIDRQHRVIFLGGDHSITIGTIGGITHREPAAMLYIDAHGDFNTPETSVTGNIHGMTVATLIGMGHPDLVDIGRPGPKLTTEDIVLLGIRELDDPERDTIRASGISVFTMRDIDERGISTITREALDRLGNHRLHVSLDLDAIDPGVAPGVGTATQGGMTYREAQLLCEIIADSRRLVSLDLVEINPILDQGNQTACLAVDLAVSLFGKRIL